MIVRSWSGSVPRSKAEDFRKHLERTGVADYHARPDCLSAEIWSQEQGDRIRFTLVSHWVSQSAIIAYAGSDWDRAVLYPGDDALGLEPDLTVTHFELCDGGFAR